MALRKIITEGDSLLRKSSRAVGEITDRTRTLVADMWETMYDANGIGLAAPQVGVLRRIVVIDATEPDETDGAESEAEPVKYTLINPEIIERSEETVSAKEGCLSVPGMAGIVNRAARVTVRALELSGKQIELVGEGLLAKALQHEIDHLNGILYTDVAESVEEVQPE